MNDVTCWRCQIRSWEARLRRTSFEPCEACRARLRLAQSAWKSWSQEATGSHPSAVSASAPASDTEPAPSRRSPFAASNLTPKESARRLAT